MKHAFVSLALTLALTAAGQVAAPPSVQSNRTPPGAVTAPAAPSFNDIIPLLSQLEQAAQTANMDAGKLRVDKWKTDSAIKQQSQANVTSIQRNITSALPGMIQQVRSDPQSMAGVFKLYRNVSALYDVLSSLTESAGAFGPKNEFQMLAADATRLDAVRRTLGDRMEGLASYKDSEVTRLRTQVAQARPAAPTKKIVDDNQPTKKTARKKKPAKPAATPQ